MLCIVAGEVKRHGVCDWPLDKIAAHAGVSRTTSQNAIRKAHQHGHIAVQARPVRGRKNLPNVVSIVCAEWLAWIKRAPAAARLIGFNSLNPTKNVEIKQEQKEKDACNEERKVRVEAWPQTITQLQKLVA